jgi:hypothetical protein
MNKKNLFVFILVALCFSVLIYFAPQNEFCEGGADNYWHYFFSKYSYLYPKFFLHHWGKPLFILLSAPFAQFGFNGIKLFNILCGILSSLICYRFCKELGLKYSWLVIPILIFTPVYFLVLQTALTEPLFSLALVFSCYLLYKESFLAGAIVASFLLFSRTEGLFILIYFSFYLLLIKKWKYIPLLSTGFIIYALIGFISGHSFFWFFTEMPYSVDSPYGHGDWLHFFKFYKNIWGEPHLLLLLPGILLLILNSIKNKELNVFKNVSNDAKIVLLILAPAVMFFGFHVVAWKYGKFASAGLERVFACIIPFTAILCVYAFDVFTKLKFPKWIVYLAVVVYLFFIVSYPFNVYHFPLKAVSDEKAEREAAEWFKKNRKDGYTIYYAHPAIVFYADLNPFDIVNNKECFAYYKDCAIEKKKPFYYFWDSAFSEFSCNTSTADLERCGMKRIKEFKEDNFQLYIYEFIPIE